MASSIFSLAACACCRLASLSLTSRSSPCSSCRRSLSASSRASSALSVDSASRRILLVTCRTSCILFCWATSRPPSAFWCATSAFAALLAIRRTSLSWARIATVLFWLVASRAASAVVKAPSDPEAVAATWLSFAVVPAYVRSLPCSALVRITSAFRADLSAVLTLATSACRPPTSLRSARWRGTSVRSRATSATFCCRSTPSSLALSALPTFSLCAFAFARDSSER
mmetsp:Transcript_87872/g.262037  ORF Transcript_87872/g.262037 Transcript_87872/m.262037 type:complete len:227 (+) Transcript_87872:680-1360(+)